MTHAPALRGGFPCWRADAGLPSDRPDAMIIKTAEALRESGARLDRLRYDLPDEIG